MGHYLMQTKSEFAESGCIASACMLYMFANSATFALEKDKFVVFDLHALSQLTDIRFSCAFYLTA